MYVLQTSLQITRRSDAEQGFTLIVPGFRKPFHRKVASEESQFEPVPEEDVEIVSDLVGPDTVYARPDGVDDPVDAFGLEAVQKAWE